MTNLAGLANLIWGVSSRRSASWHHLWSDGTRTTETWVPRADEDGYSVTNARC